MVDLVKPRCERFGGWWARTSRHPIRLVTMRAGVLLAAAMQAADVGAATGSIRFPLYGASLVNLGFAPTIPVPGRINAGQVLQSVSHVSRVETSNVTCAINETAVVNGTAAPGKTNIFMTNLRGLGVRYSVTGNWANNSTTAPYSTIFRPPATGAAEYRITAELVVTDPLGSGTLSTIPSLTIALSGPCFDRLARTQYVTPGSTLTASTCSVATRSIHVALLPRVSPSNLAGVGATPFSIGLDCAAPVRAYLSLSDAANPGNRSTVLSAAPGSTATGVGMQIMSGTTALAFGPASAESGGVRASSVGRLSAGANLIPLSARYVRTGPVSGGTVKGLATFTMSYQ